jgi:hypothetical protein
MLRNFINKKIFIYKRMENQNQNQFIKLIFADRTSYDISGTLFQKLENLKDNSSDHINSGGPPSLGTSTSCRLGAEPQGGTPIYIERNPELFNKYVLKYIQGYQKNIEIENFIDFSTFLNEMNYYGVKMSLQDLISIQMNMPDFNRYIDIVHRYFRRRINKKTGTFKGFRRMKKWRPVFIQISQFCKKISPKIDLASKILEILFFDDQNRPLYVLNAEITNVVYYVVEKLANKILHNGDGFIDIMTLEDSINEMVNTNEPLKVVQAASRIF